MKECSVAYALCTTYMPALLEVAEEYLKARALAVYKGEKTWYTDVLDSDGYTVTGSDGFSFRVDLDREKCLDLVRRLNS